MYQDDGKEIATLAGGCFWCLEAIFRELYGVDKVISGYCGGCIQAPTYYQVCSGLTGHAEVVQIIFNPQIISFRELLEIFLTVHDPTTLNQQGADVGTQYRSAIFYHSSKQKQIAEQVIMELSEARVWQDPIVTEVTLFQEFYKAEDSHQNYYLNNFAQPYCQIIIEPKVAKFRKHYRAKLKR